MTTVVLFVVDSLRADAVGYAGGPPTPTIDALAAAGTAYEQAICSATWTVPSLAAMATGTLPHRLGVVQWRHPFPTDRPTLMSVLEEAGFETRVLVPNPSWAFRSTPGVSWIGDSQRPDDVVAALRSPPDRDLFVLVHHWWTHLPYIQKDMSHRRWRALCDATLEVLAADPELGRQRLRDLYRRAVAHFDTELLPRYLDAAAAGGGDVVVALTGDHGESWGEEVPNGRPVEHIFDLHGRWIADSTIRVPMLLSGAGVERRVVRDRVFRGVDVAPTLADLAGVPWTSPREDSGLITVATHNVYEPETYLRDGRVMWRRFGAHAGGSWHLADFVDGLRQGDDARVQAHLAALHAEAVDSPTMLPRSFFVGSQPPESPLESQMRTLGYLD